LREIRDDAETAEIEDQPGVEENSFPSFPKRQSRNPERRKRSRMTATIATTRTNKMMVSQATRIAVARTATDATLLL
jgi:hypothetical protein